MLSIIVAFDKNQLIGKENKMPWYYPEDFQYFKEITTGKIVVMGSRTYQSILDLLHKPLPNRQNIVITSKKDKYKDVECYDSVEHFLDVYQNRTDEIFVIGGKSIYQQFIDAVDRLYITHINQEFSGDTYFPLYNKNFFELVSQKKNGDLNFCIYERKVKAHE